MQIKRKAMRVMENPASEYELRIFMGASKLPLKEREVMSSEEREAWEQNMILDGVKRFKRRTLGLCGVRSVKSLDELGQIAYEIGMTNSIEDGRGVIKLLAGHTFKYGKNWLNIEEGKNLEGQTRYVIHKVYRLYIPEVQK